MTALGAMHLIFSLTAIVFGAVVVLARKGTRWHRTWGHAYVWSMLLVIGTAFSIYGRTGRAGPFHLAALVAAVTIAGGLYSVLGRRPKRSWMEAHAIWMSWSYIGLMAAFAAETLSRWVMPRVSDFLVGNSLLGAFWASVGVATFVIVGVGARLVKVRLPGALAATLEAVKRERVEFAAIREEVGPQS